MSAVAEIISSVAILITLIYLAVQTQQNTAAIEAQVVSNRAGARAAIFELITQHVGHSIENPGIRLGLSSTEPLDPETRAQIDGWLILYFGTREFVWLQYQDGVVDQATFETIIDERGMLANPRVSEWWDRRATELYDAEFVDLINSQFRN